MHKKEWELFEWEEELKVLGLEYFFIGNKIENLLGPPNGRFSVSESMRVTDLLTDLQGYC